MQRATIEIRYVVGSENDDVSADRVALDKKGWGLSQDAAERAAARLIEMNMQGI
jgi:hypothetical protein